ncbi:hypothetical protein RJ641_009583 [Dillenia turbinata]|uniref:Uncharacterized protein n=1 Tax=Dillenia turbinata TaxID=194707 RepID=A0AAN8VD66_9MAGN
MAEQELKGFEVELNLNETSIQTIEAKISLIQDEISAIGKAMVSWKSVFQNIGHVIPIILWHRILPLTSPDCLWDVAKASADV